jgi:hypothetical protein
MPRCVHTCFIAVFTDADRFWCVWGADFAVLCQIPPRKSQCWYEFIRGKIDDQVKRRFGSAPVFRHDKGFAPLKSANVYAWQVRRHLAKEQPLGIHHNDNLDSLLSIFGVSTIVEADHMHDFVWHSRLEMGLMLKSRACHFIPKR